MAINTTFDLIASIAAAITAVIAVIGLIFAIVQVREAKKARVLDAYLAFEHRLDDQREERNRFYEADLEDPTKITLEDRHILESVCVTFDMLGVLIREDLMYRPLIFKPYYDVIIKSWKKARNYIIFERQEFRKTRAYMLDFEYLFNEAEKYRLKKHFPEVKIYAPYPQGIGVDMVKIKRVHKVEK
jgi:hypothetical protein